MNSVLLNNEVLEIAKSVEVALNRLTSSKFLKQCVDSFVNTRKEFEVSNPVVINDLSNANGLYLFWVKCPSEGSCVLDVLRKNWDRRISEAGNHPKINNSRAKKVSLYNNDWVPFYLGKSKSIRKRILEHVNKPVNSKTYAMRLSECIGMQDLRFAISVLDFAPLGKSYYLCERLEVSLRNCINPIIGRQ